MKSFNAIKNMDDARFMAKSIIKDLKLCHDNDPADYIGKDIASYTYYTKQRTDEIKLYSCVYVSKCKELKKSYFVVDARLECNGNDLCDAEFYYTQNQTQEALAKVLFDIAEASSPDTLKKYYHMMDQTPIYELEELPVYKFEYNFNKQKITCKKLNPDSNSIPEKKAEDELIWTPESVTMFSYSKKDMNYFCSEIASSLKNDCNTFKRSLELAQQKSEKFQEAWDSIMRKQ